MKEISFDFITLLTIVRKQWKLISAFAIAGIIAGYILNYFAVPKYRASIDVFTCNKDFSAAIKKVKTDKDLTIKTFEDIAEYKMLCLGAIPFVKTEKSDQAIFLESQGNAKSSGQDWHAREAFRLVQSSIRFVNPDNPPKVICTTSVLPNTGKTTVTANLAMTFYEAGSKVLILDCDLRKPHIHKLFAIENDTGIVNYLVDHEGHSLDKFIHRILDGFDIMSCGTIPPNPTQLLYSNKFAEMFSELKRRYDYILVDCPPIANMADTMIIGDLVDGMIMGINSGKTRADYLKHALGQLNEIRQKIVGVVFNKNSSGKPISYEGYFGGYYKGYYKGYY
ncbi:MAG: polysaccharide biosynthesis tyrosine autokinase [Victivallaceae bacterium]|nr:polysaccharide biosynthesis tyrosine autokinase [Victivallaceae bacterium]